MKRLYIRILVASITFSLGVIVATLFITRRHLPTVPPEPVTASQINNALSKIPEVAPLSYPEANSIRSIDFKNFTYPGTIYGEYKNYFPEESFTLKKGKWGDWRYGMTLLNVSYGDVTGDHKEEAILNFSQDTEGSAGQNSIYIYTIENARPKLLRAFTSGDRSDGGLRKVYAQGGKLIIELYGKETKIIGSSSNSSAEFTGMCCPKSYTRTQYKWIDGSFQQDGEMEVFPNRDNLNGSPLKLEQ